MRAPDLKNLKWQNCEKKKPSANGYYAVKHDLKRGLWYVNYYLRKEDVWLFLNFAREWTMHERPWMWTKLPEVEDGLYDGQEVCEQGRSDEGVPA